MTTQVDQNREDEDGRISKAQSGVQPKDTKSLTPLEDLVLRVVGIYNLAGVQPSRETIIQAVQLLQDSDWVRATKL